MNADPHRAVRLTVVASVALMGGVIGLIVGYFHRLPGQPPYPEVREFPLPHHVPQYAGC
jgi:hypothetical protein